MMIHTSEKIKVTVLFLSMMTGFYPFAVHAQNQAPAKTQPGNVVVPVANPEGKKKAAGENNGGKNGLTFGNDTIEVVIARIKSNKQKIQELEDKIVEKNNQIGELVKIYNKTDTNLTGFSGLGKVEQLELKAELYANELRARKKLSDEFAGLADIVKEWVNTKKILQEDMKVQALADKVNEVKAYVEENAKAAAAGATPSANNQALENAKKLEQIEYYQVKQDADLRTISSYPEVYGAPEYWEHLYKANKNTVSSDPTKIVPAGTRLIVPQNVKKLPDFSEF